MWSSSSLSSSLSPSSSTNINIEQVWNDFTVPGPIPTPPHLHRPSTPRVILQDFFSKEPPPAPVSPPPTLLTLNTSHDHFGTLLLNPYHPPLNVPFVSDDVAGKKRFTDSDGYSRGDCRNKRMMKNRVSAARSRARKQEIITLNSTILHAYTNELELQVANLRRQNATLRKQQEQLHIAAAAAGGEVQEEKKKKKCLQLHRTSSAPF